MQGLFLAPSSEPTGRCTLVSRGNRAGRVFRHWTKTMDEAMDDGIRTVPAPKKESIQKPPRENGCGDNQQAFCSLSGRPLLAAVLARAR
jgi:hypothetical protein